LKFISPGYAIEFQQAHFQQLLVEVCKYEGKLPVGSWITSWFSVIYSKIKQCENYIISSLIASNNIIN
jgi:hypothetical protein